MLADFWILAPSPCWDAEFFEDKFIKDKGLSLKNVLENAEMSIAPDESITPEAEGTDAEEETPEL